MLLLTPLLAPFVLLATRAVADPATDVENLITIPIFKRHVSSAGTVNIAQRDHIRLRFLLRGGKYLESLTPDVLLNDAGAVYIALVGIGDPARYCESCLFPPYRVPYILILDQLFVDTGSANTWVKGNKPYIMTTSSIKTSNSFVSIVSCHGIPVSSD